MAARRDLPAAISSAQMGRYNKRDDSAGRGSMHTAVVVRVKPLALNTQILPHLRNDLVLQPLLLKGSGGQPTRDS